MHIYLPDRRAACCQAELLIEKLTRLLPLAVGDRSEKETEREKKKLIDFNERKCNKIFIVSNIYF